MPSFVVSHKIFFLNDESENAFILKTESQLIVLCLFDLTIEGGESEGNFILCGWIEIRVANYKKFNLAKSFKIYLIPQKAKFRSNILLNI